MERSFDFFGNQVQISSNNEDIVELIERNFSLFLGTPDKAKTSLLIKLELTKEIPIQLIPKLVSIQQTRNAVVYEDKTTRYCDYYSEGLVIFKKKENSAVIYTKELGFLHELTYLFIMSKVGKSLDNQGLHRIHACAFKKDETAFVCMMPMKGGKSTLFLKMLENKDVEIYSDDTPLVSSSGNIMAFPVRMGIKELPEYLNDKNDFVFELQRKEFGPKNLIDMKAFSNKIAKESKKVVLIDCVRTTHELGKIKRISRLQIIFPLVKYMGIGLGLPIIIEFFLENGIRGWKNQLIILFKRLYAILRLALKAKCYRLYMGVDRQSNIKVINERW
jgi:hypothetical protein